jgi:hypothetical protein
MVQPRSRDALVLGAILSSFVACVCVAACSGSSDASNDFPQAPYASFAVDGQPLDVELRTSPAQPPERGVLSVELRVKDANGAPKDGLTLDVVPWMPAHGHGSSVIPVVTAEGDGVYRVDRLQLAMPGTWQLRLALHAPDLDARATATLEVR